MLQIFQVILLTLAASSADERLSISDFEMSAQAFAHIHYLSFDNTAYQALVLVLYNDRGKQSKFGNCIGIKMIERVVELSSRFCKHSEGMQTRI